MDILSQYGSVIGYAAVAIIAMLVITLFLKKCLIVCGADEIIVISGAGSGKKKDSTDESSGAIVRHAGLVFYLPGLQTYRRISLKPRSLDVTLKSVPCSNFIDMDVTANITYTVGNSPILMRRAAIFLGSDTEIQSLALTTVSGVFRSVINQNTVEELINGKEKFQNTAKEQLESVMQAFGLMIMNINLRDVNDSANTYVKSLSERASAEVVNKAAIDVANLDRDAAITLADTARAKETSVARANSSKDTELRDIETTRNIELATKTNLETLQLAELNRAREVELARVTATQQVETNSQLSRTLESDATLAITRATENARSSTASARATKEILEADQQVALERARLEEVTPIIIQNEIEVANETARASALKIAAEARASAVRTDADAEAYAITVRGTAEADAQRRVNETRVELFETLVKACNGDTNAVVNIMMTEKAEVIAATYAQALSNIKFDKITLMGGSEGKGGAGIADFIRDFAGCLPSIHEMAHTTGIALPALFGSMNDMPPKEVVERVINSVDVTDKEKDDTVVTVSDDSVVNNNGDQQ